MGEIERYRAIQQPGIQLAVEAIKKTSPQSGSTIVNFIDNRITVTTTTQISESFEQANANQAPAAPTYNPDPEIKWLAFCLFVFSVILVAIAASIQSHSCSSRPSS